MHDLTRKGRQFIWGEEKQHDFDELKRLVKLSVLQSQESNGRFHLY